MKATIRLYEKTGFNGVNVPYSPDKLPAPAKIKTDYLFLNSSQNVTKIRLSKGLNETNDWMKYDYVSITGDTWGGFETCYYWVTNYEIITNQEIEYTLAPDWWTTVGGAPVIGSAIQDGMVSRIPKADALARAATGGLNIIEDKGFQPSQPLRLLFNYDTSDDIRNSTGEQVADITVIASTIDISNNARLAQTFEDIVNNRKVTVPTLPPVSEDSYVQMGGMRYELAGVGLYQYYRLGQIAENTKENIRMIWGINLQDGIKSVYKIPKEILNYFNCTVWKTVTVQGQAPRLDFDCPWKEVRVPLANLYTHESGGYDFVERQAIAKFAKLILASETSGDNKAFNLTDVAQILDGSATNDYIDLMLTADMSPGGKTYIKPKSFQGRTNTYFKNSVVGTPWLTQPMTMEGVSGAMVSQGLQALRNSYAEDQIGNQIAASTQLNMMSEQFQHELNEYNYLRGGIGTGLDMMKGLAGGFIENAGRAFMGQKMPYGIEGGKHAALYNLETQQQVATMNAGMEQQRIAINGEQAWKNQALANSLAQKEIALQNNLVAPTLLFNRDPGICNFVLNGFYIGVAGLSQSDVSIFRRYMNFNGVAVCQPFKVNDSDGFREPTSTEPYSYYKFESLKFKKNTLPSIIGNEIQVQLLNGVRMCGTE